MDEVERRLRAIGRRQESVFSVSQLRGCGLTPRQIEHRQHNGQLQRLHHGIYLASYASPTLRQRAFAALLAAGGGRAAVSHAWSGVLQGFLRARLGDVEITAAHPVRRPCICAHRAALGPEDTWTVNGLRLTRPARVICELAPTSTLEQLERALQEALVKRLTTADELRRAAARWGRRAGAGQLRELLLGQAHGPTRSAAERAFARLINRAGLPPPQRNVLIEGHLVDMVWREQRLIVEIDGAAHDNPVAFRRDRRRDASLTATGWRVMRFTPERTLGEPAVVASQVAAALARP